MLKIKEAREARGWTQERLAQTVGTTQQTIQRWESGEVDPKSGKVMSISAALGITVSFIMGTDQPELSEDEKRLVELYRSMPKTSREKMLAFAEISAVVYDDDDLCAVRGSERSYEKDKSNG